MSADAKVSNADGDTGWTVSSDGGKSKGDINGVKFTAKIMEAMRTVTLNVGMKMS